MDDSYQNFIHPKVHSLNPYSPGKSIAEIENKYFIHDVVKMASNENPSGASPRVLEAIAACSMDKIAVYPNSYQHPLCHCLAEFLQLPTEQLFLASGSDAIFSLLIQAYAIALQKNILTHQYAFMGYEIQASSFGLNTIKVPVNPNTWQIYPEEFIAQAHNNVGIIFLANPNNPTGQSMSHEQIITLLKHIPKHCLLVIDQAYYEFSDKAEPDLLQELQYYPNLIITRTFSKAYGLAGLRLGYAMAHPDIVATLKKIQLPFTINRIALDAGLAALLDQNFIVETRRINRKGQNQLLQALTDFPFKIHAYNTNFITIEHQDDVSHLVTFLETQGIIVRPLHAFGLNKAIRITIGLYEQNQKLISALKNYFSKE